MNNFLANLMRYGNGFIGVVFILFFPLLVLYLGLYEEGSVSWMYLSILVYIVAVATICGTLAIFISMRSELIKIRELLEKK